MYENLNLPDIALIGKAGAGKSTVAEVLATFGYQRHSFAAKLRNVAVDLWGEEARNDRDKLQKLGVAVRGIEADTWVDNFVRDVEQAADDPLGRAVPYRVVVDDCRFPNEVWRLAELGFVFVRVEADRSTRIVRLKANGKLQDEAQLVHASETALDGQKADYVINNDNKSHEELYGDVIDLLNRLAR